VSYYDILLFLHIGIAAIVVGSLLNEKTPPKRGFREVGGTGIEPVTSGLSSRRSPS
jgi:hypothetical protein